MKLVKELEISVALGMITLWRFHVSSSVERMLICFILPSSPLIKTQSPTLNGRSNKMIMPETKFFITSCKPKPIPTDRAPAMTAKLDKSTPMATIPKIMEMVMPIKLVPETSECLMPSSILIRLSKLFAKRFFKILTKVKEMMNTARPVAMAISDISIPPTLKPKITFLMPWSIKVPGTPHRRNSE